MWCHRDPEHGLNPPIDRDREHGLALKIDLDHEHGLTPSINWDQEHDLKSNSLRSEENRNSTCAQSEVLCFTIVNRQYAYQFGELKSSLF
jgi:hypothetical protein